MAAVTIEGIIAVTVVVNRRERVRAATVQEIKDVARQQLVAHGPGAVSLRAIARDMGMTAPALYRYFPSFDHLVRALVADMYDEACGVMTTARDSVAVTAPGGRLVAAAQAFRGWAVAHRAEFGLIFGSPLQALPVDDPPTPPPGPTHRADGTAIVIGLFEQMWQHRPYLTPAPDDLSAALLQQLAAYRETHHTDLPVTACYVAISTWSRILGLVSLEVFGHTPFSPRDGEALFSQQLRELVNSLGVAEVVVLSS